MKKFLVFLLITILICSCKKESFDIIGDPVNLMTNDDPSIFEKTVILFDDNNYLIKTPLDSFILGSPFNLHDGHYDDYKNRAIR